MEKIKLIQKLINHIAKNPEEVEREMEGFYYIIDNKYIKLDWAVGGGGNEKWLLSQASGNEDIEYIEKYLQYLKSNK